MLRPAPRSASIGSVRVANHAGAAPNTMPGDEREAERERQHHRRRRVSIGRNVAPAKASASSRRAAPTATTSPAIAAGDGEQDALDERLRHDLPARCAHREPDGRLAAPRDGAREQQIRDVGAGDEQHQRRTRRAESAGCVRTAPS